MSSNNNKVNSDIEKWKKHANKVKKIFLYGQWGMSMLSAFAFALNAYQEFGIDPNVYVGVGMGFFQILMILFLWKGIVPILLAGWTYSILVTFVNIAVAVTQGTYILCFVYLLIHPTMMNLIYGARDMIIVQLSCLGLTVWLATDFAANQIKNGIFTITSERLYYDAKACIPMSTALIVIKIFEIIITKKRDELLVTMNEKIIAEAESKDIFFASMSHEMRNPLNTLLGTIEIMLCNVSMKKNIDPKHLQSAQFSGEILLNLIGNILDFTKIQAHKMNIIPSPVDIREKIYNILQMFKQLANKNGITLEYIPDENIPSALEIDQSKLNQCIINLIGNAIKFTPKGGKISIKTCWFPVMNEQFDHIRIKEKMDQIFKESSREENLYSVRNIMNDGELHQIPNKLPVVLASKMPPFDIFSMSESELDGFSWDDSPKSHNISSNRNRSQMFRIRNAEYGILKIEIIDSGIGISPKQQEHLFEPFQQADKNTSKKYGGTGLGLWVSKGLIQQMGGDIRIESESEMGSNFLIGLPVAISKEQGAMDNRITSEQLWVLYKDKFKGKVCLYVDDQDSNQALMTELLSHMGLKVISAGNGKSGLEKIIKNHHVFDFILTDLRMPIMSGQQMICQIREFENLNKLEKVKIIVLTAEPSENERNNCMYIYGTNDFLIKPISFADLTVSINKLLKLTNFKSQSCSSNYSGFVENSLLMIIDDDPLSSSITKQLLEPLHMPILQSYSIKESIEKLIECQGKIVCILLDSHLSDGTGIEAYQQIRNIKYNGKRDSSFIISISGDSISQQKEMFHQVNIDAFLTKPFTRQKLVELIKSLLI